MKLPRLRQWHWLLLGLLGALMLGVAACGDGEEGPVEATAPVIKIGIIADLSGPIGGNPILLSTVRGGEVGFADINKAGGVDIGGKRYRIEVIKVDSRSNPVDAVAGAQQLIGAGVLAVDIATCAFAPQVYAQIKAASPGIIAYTNCPPLLNLLDKDVPVAFEGTEKNPLLFTAIDFTLPIIAGWLKQIKKIYPDIKTVAGMWDDSPLGRAQAAVMPAAAQEAGLQYLGPAVHFPLGTTDVSAFLTIAKDRKPDLVYMSASGNLDAPRQFIQLNVAPRVMIPGLRPVDLQRIGDVGNTTIVMLDWRQPYHREVVPSEFKERAEAFGTLEGGLPVQMGFTVAFYDFALLLKKAIEKANTVTDPSAIAKALVGQSTDSYFGGKVAVFDDHATRGQMGNIVTTKDKFTVYLYPDATTDTATSKYEVKRQ